MPKRSAIFTLVLLLAAFSLCACGLLSAGSDGGCDADMLNALRIAPLPSTADLMESCVEGFAPGNAQYRATFTLDPADLPAFQASTRVSSLGTTLSGGSVYRDEAAGMTSLQSGTFGDGAIMEEILVDTSNPQTYKVYFYRAFVD